MLPNVTTPSTTCSIFCLDKPQNVLCLIIGGSFKDLLAWGQTEGLAQEAIRGAGPPVKIV